MGAGFYLMVAFSIVVFNLALMDKKKGWIWAGVNVCVTMVLGKTFGVTVLVAIAGFVITMLGMSLINLIKPRKLN